MAEGPDPGRGLVKCEFTIAGKCHQKFSMCFRADRFQSPSLSVITGPLLWRTWAIRILKDWFGLACNTMCVEIDFTWSFSSPATDTPLLKELWNELDSVVDWHSLGIKLGMKHHELGTIEKNYHGDTVRCKHEMLASFEVPNFQHGKQLLMLFVWWENIQLPWQYALSLLPFHW